MSSNNFGLSDNELKIALCALKVTVVDGKVEKGHLAKLTGHANPDSAQRVWYMVKKKIMETNITSLVDVDTPTKGPKKTPANMRTPNPKKRSKKQAAEKEDDTDAEVDEKPAKRVKKEVVEDTGLDMIEDEN
ncbi:hypothetical protein UCDDA912_g05071 [Diaporthe ampelina]|uniref:Uncharacterized protein n=1 Tax=Diaporthe ampelina TaxID=1214573 RepID=A0A0G2I510_9PEZI|nr:hypothetical protein UCDDA912_g05071 [Diaporthe ampelina]